MSQPPTMRPWQQALEIARWEFARLFKLRDVLLSLVITAVVVGVTWGLSAWQARTAAPARVAVIAPAGLELEAPPERVRFERREAAAETALRAAVAAGELDGLVVLADAGAGATLVVRKDPPWRAAAQAAIDAAVQQQRLDALGVSREALAAALAPVPVAVELTSGPSRGPAKLAAGLLCGLMLLTLLTATSYLFVAITGEKQQRASEQLFTIVPAQALVDGKLLGILAVSLVGALQIALVGAVGWNATSPASLRRFGAALAAVAPGEAAVIAGFAIAGTLFWMCFTAAFFATINDPNSSARSSSMMLPFLPLSAVFIGLSSPDSAMMQVLGLLPFTAMTVVPARLVLGEVSAAYVATSLVLLMASTWLLRVTAARIYAAGMLMYGKEASVREMLRWALRGPEP